ncbi:uncharacterized protein LOC118204067 [Stegodyphus dumicola]|uniref:uncharacterized protein LOC118204067 n=1 Tax=Stegodyphus dumicola TaxID=202533 RepID=UPI0015AAB242|nr:uncharacterized protein LOC118204067 [Stegodyphus dumicola]
MRDISAAKAGNRCRRYFFGDNFLYIALSMWERKCLATSQPTVVMASVKLVINWDVAAKRSKVPKTCTYCQVEGMMLCSSHSSDDISCTSYTTTCTTDFSAALSPVLINSTKLTLGFTMCFIDYFIHQVKWYCGHHLTGQWD